MAMTLADIRTKYPQYAAVDDAKLADAIYNKHYAGKDRREFDARIGLKPYDNALETMGKALVSAPAQVMQGLSGVGQQLAEGEAGDPNTIIDALGPGFDNSKLTGVDRLNFGNWLRAEIGGDPGKPFTPEQQEQALALASSPEAKNKFEAYVRNPDNRYIGTRPERIAMADLKGQLERKQLDKSVQKIDAAPGSAEEIAANAVGSIAQMAPGYAASIATRNPLPAVALAQTLTQGQAYAQARDAGVDPGKAAEYAMSSGFAEAVGEALPLGMILKEGGGKLLPKLFKAGVAEATQEAVTQFIQSMLESGTVTPEMTWGDVQKQVISAAATGAVAGTALTGVTAGIDAMGKKPTAESVSAEVLAPAAETVEETPIEDNLALPAPATLLALPSPESFKTPDVPRRQGPAPAAKAEPVAPTPTEDEIDYQARVALQKTRQAETAELLQTARETITPLGTFDVDEIGEAAAGKVRQHRIQMGRPVEAPVTIEDMARAKVPQRQIDAVIAQRRPVTSETALTALDIMRAADAKNIIPTDGNFAELALRVTGQRNPARMTQAQLNALKTTLDAMPAHDKPVTVPLAEQSPFTDDQYGKALDAVRKQGRYTAGAIKEATGLKGTKDVDAIRDAMVRRGQLVQRGKSDYRLYDTLGEERQTVPDDLPAGAFKEYTTKRVPVARVRVVKDGKSVGVFGSAAEARGKVSSLRATDGGTKAAISIEPAEEVAWGVMENRYDEQGNLLGSVVVDSHRDETAAAEAMAKLNAPADTGARYTQTTVEPNARLDATPVPRRAPMPAAFTGRLPEITKRLNDQARARKLPLLGVKVKIEPSIVTPEGEAIEGFYFRKLISLTAQNLTPQMSTEEIVERLGQVMDHETIHALRAADVLGPETDGWKTIVRYARKAQRPGSTETYMEWARRNYADVPGYGTNDAIEEEAIAEAFRHWAANRRDVAGKPATVFRQIVDWFKRLVSSLPEDAFKAIESGQLVANALKPPGGEMPRATATRKMEAAAAEISAAQKAMDENLVRVKSREFLRARAQARDDRYGKSGPKTVLGTTPSKAYAVGEVGDTEAVRAIADRYRSQNGVQQGRLMTLLPEDIGYLSRIADAQQRLPHAPGDAAVAKSYRALIDETKAMWRALGDIEVTAWADSGAPYASPADMLADVEAGRLRMRLSDDMFGPGADNPGHPLNTASGYKTVDGKALTNNDLFRVVHDIYGHGQSGFRDDPRGSYNAYHEHARLLSPEARRALATETLAQRAWQNYGPHLRRRDGTVPRETDVDYLAPRFKEFAEQKAFVLDDEVLGADPGWALADAAAVAEPEEFGRMMVAYHGTPHKVDKFSSSKIGTGEGAQSFGYGLYFAGKKEVAEHYRDTLAGDTVGPAQRALKKADGDIDAAIAAADAEIQRLKALPLTPDTGSAKRDTLVSAQEANVRELTAYRRTGNWASGNLYKVDIPEDTELLDWDATMREQPREVRAKLEAALGQRVHDDLRGEEVYNSVKRMFQMGQLRPAGISSATRPDIAASQILRDAGLPGHRFLDQGSRLGSDAAALVQKYGSRAKALEIAEQRIDEASIAKHRNDWEKIAKQLREEETRNYVIYDDSRVQILEENPKFSKFDDNLPGGHLYGNPNRSPGGALSAPGTPSPAFTADRPGNAFFGGELAEHQLQMARTGERGATMIYLAPADYLALTDGSANPEQEIYDAAVRDGFKFAGMPSLVLDGYAGNVRASVSDGAFAAEALREQGPIPVVLYPRKGDSLGLVTALEAPDGRRVPWPHDGRAENFPEVRGPRYSVGSEEFRAWFGDSKVVGPDGAPLVVFHGTGSKFTAFDPKARAVTDGGMGLEDAGVRPFFFTSSEEIGRDFAGGDSDYVMPVFLSLQNPLVIEADRKGWENYHDQIVEAALGETHDGMILRNLSDSMFGEVEDPVSDVYVAFEPTQIKSAIANNGQYDAANPDIRYSLNAPFGTRVPRENNATLTGPRYAKRDEEFDLFSGQSRPATEEADGMSAAAPERRNYNIVQQRIEGVVGRTLVNIARDKKDRFYSGILARLPLSGGSRSIYDLRIKLQDKMLSVKELIEYIRDNEGALDDINDTYMLEQLYHGKVFEEIDQREKNLYVPLLEAMKAAHDGPTKVQPIDLDDYLYARHAPERNAYLRARGSKISNPSGMSDAEASAILDKFAIDGKLGTLEDLAAMADQISADTTQTRVDAGLITQEAADSSPYQYYVPLRGFAEEALDPGNPNENPARARSGKGFSISGREDRRVTGRERKAGDLLGHLFLQNTEAVIRAQKNEVALSFARLAQDNPQFGFADILKAAPTRRVVGPNGMIQEAGDPSYRQQPDIVIAKWKGKEIIIRTDPRLARAINSDYVTSSNDIVNSLTDIARWISRYQSKINTSLAPEFIVTNLMRDTGAVAILGNQYDIKNFSMKVIANAPKAALGIREVLRGGTETSPMAQAFRDLQRAGGTVEFMDLHTLESQLAAIRKSVTRTGLNPTARQALGHIQRTMKFVEDYNKVIENALRLSAFVTAKEAGVSTPQAAYLAKNITTNFNKGGENKAFVNAWYMFFNAGMQGTWGTLSALKSKRMQHVVAGVVAMGATMDIINRLFGNDDDDDNGVPDYDEIPAHILQRNMVVMDPFGLTDKGYFAFTLPLGLNAFYNMGRNVSGMFSNSPVKSGNPLERAGRAASDTLLTFLDVFNPMGGVQSWLNFIAPTIADPFVDLATNKDFAGTNIIPERPTFGVPVPDSQKYWTNTGPIPQWVAEHLNRLSGGNEVRKGAMDVSPEWLQYGFDYATGGIGQFVQRTGKMGWNTIQQDFTEVKVGDVPFVRRFYGSAGERGNAELYYAAAKEIQIVAEEMKLFGETGDVEALRRKVAEQPVEVRLIGMFEDAEKALSALRKQMREVRENEQIPDARKRDIVKQIKEQQDLLMARVNSVYFEQKKAGR